MEELGVGSPLVHGTQNKGSGGRGTKAASCRGNWSFGSSSRSFPKEQRCSLLGCCLLSAGWTDKFRQGVPGLLDELQISKTSVVMQKKMNFMAVGALCSVTEFPTLFHLMGEEGMKCCKWEEQGRHRASQALLPFLTQNNNCVMGLINWDERYSSGAKLPLQRSPVVCSLCVFACFDAHLCEFGNMRSM